LTLSLWNPRPALERGPLITVRRQPREPPGDDDDE